MIDFTIVLRKKVGPFEIYERKPKPVGMTKYLVTKSEDETAKDFGRYSAAIRWCKGQCPRVVPHVVIVEGGELVVSTMPVRYTIIDGPHRNTGDALVDPEQVEEFTKPK